MGTLARSKLNARRRILETFFRFLYYKLKQNQIDIKIGNINTEDRKC